MEPNISRWKFRPRSHPKYFSVTYVTKSSPRVIPPLKTAPRTPRYNVGDNKNT